MLEFNLGKLLIVNMEKVIFRSKINNDCLKSYLSLARLFNNVLYNSLKIEIDLAFIDNQIYTGQLVMMVIIKTINHFILAI